MVRKHSALDSLSTSEIAPKEIESYLYHTNLEDEGPDSIEDAYVSPILDAKYEKVDIEKVIKDNCAHLDPGKQRQLRVVLLNHGLYLMEYWQYFQANQCI